tara:strand:- start:236 stop:412 length:177 start_codon:yes stop_codon:yes gene_type:complete
MMKTKHRLNEKLNKKNSVNHDQLIQELHAELRALHFELERLSVGHSVNLNEILARREK